MKQLHVNLKHCYGIGQLDQIFSFEQDKSRDPNDITNGHVNVLYARNGVMKTSFARTIQKYISKETPVDKVRNHTPEVSIQDEFGKAVPRESIYVATSDDMNPKFDKLHELLGDKRAQQEYAELMASIEDAESQLFKQLANSMGYYGANRAQDAFNIAFPHDPGLSRTQQILKLGDDTLEPAEEAELLGLPQGAYKVLAEEKIKAFVKKEQSKLNNYVKIRDKLLSDSGYLQRGHDLLAATEVQKALQKHNFLEVDSKPNHQVILVNKLNPSDKSDPIISVEALRKMYEAENDRIYGSPELGKEFQAINTALSPAGLSDFRQLITEYQYAIGHLVNYENFLKNIWRAHLKKHRDHLEALRAIYSQQKPHIEKLQAQAKNPAAIARWRRIIEDFNAGFSMPFSMSVGNQVDAVLGNKVPTPKFHFHDGSNEFEVTLRDLIDEQEGILSKGERRALQILDIMHELSVRAESAKEHLIIFDDIADSFDYNNKYAIVEYLVKLVNNPNNGLYLVIMTHNYDFFRSLWSRFCLDDSTDKMLIAKRILGGERKISMQPAGCKDEFKRLKKEALKSDTASIIALLPFARNILEYSRLNRAAKSQEATLTKCLHRKSDTDGISSVDAVQIIADTLRGLAALSAPADSTTMYGLITKTAHEKETVGDEYKLADKITLAMSIRQYAERYIYERFTKDGQTPPIELNNQTGSWFGQFANSYPSSDDDKTRRVLMKAVIVSPESIHINSFMYEPLIDMTIDELQQTHKNIRELYENLLRS